MRSLQFAAIAASPTAAFSLSSPESYHKNNGVLRYVNPKIGTYGITPNGNGGMIPSVAPPFAMTRWTPQTRENFISQCPYNELDKHIHGFQATHQPAIWMGESGQVVLNPGIGIVKPLFEERAHAFKKVDEISTPYVYEVIIDADTLNSDHNLTESVFSPVPGGGQPVPSVVSAGANGRTRRALPLSVEPTNYPLAVQAQQKLSKNTSIKIAMTATSHVGLIDFEFHNCSSEDEEPYILVQATRQNWTGTIHVDSRAHEIFGSNPQRQDFALGPDRAPGFSGYFVTRFSEPFSSWGTTQGANLSPGISNATGQHLGAYVKFSKNVQRVGARTGVSFVSIDQARRNLDLEAPSSVSFGKIVQNLKDTWLEKLGRVTITGVNKTSSEHDPRIIWYTGLFHALQYPSDFSEPLSKSKRVFYNGYTDSVHTSNDSYYQSWSIWDTFRAEHSLLTMFAPERINGMMRTLVEIFQWTGRLPMWANLVETNIMIGTHVDAVLANALARGFRDFDVLTAWKGVKKNAYVPPTNDTGLLYYDREPYTPYEVRAGLTTYMSKGFVANDRWSESGSRTLDYAFDDYAASVVARHAGDNQTAQHLLDRSMNYRNLYNAQSAFMEARNDNGTWAGSDQGWAEGDHWIYTFNVMHDPQGLAKLMGGASKMKAKLDAYFNGGHNDQSNEPSHHAPYMYTAIGYPSATQNLTRSIAYANYNATAAGLSGNEDLGQMSAWYIFSALGFYPLNPASDQYVVGSPFFEQVTIRFPAGAATGGVGGREHTLRITAPGAPSMPFVKSVKVDGKAVLTPYLSHQQIVTASTIELEMASWPQEWGRI